MDQPSTLRETLRTRNISLSRDCKRLESLLSKATIPYLLEPYRQTMIRLCRGALSEVQGSLLLLERNNDTLLEDILSKTRVADHYLRLSGQLAAPVLRSAPDDTLCLTILHWIHQAHPKACHLPVAFADGDVAIWPFIELAPLYFFPSLEQGGLLHQPLHFHEFGHALYRLHKPEMDELIKEIQQVVERELMPLSDRSDPHSRVQAERREQVVNCWFDWAQEFFCDAVGLTLGGPAYIYSFSAYCGSLSASDFSLPRSDMERSKHPTHGLRIRFLVRRARELGFHNAANRVEAEWDMLSRELGVTIDHQGFYEENMANDIHRIVGDMLLETNPRLATPDEIAPVTDATSLDTPTFLLNRAWNMHLADAEGYATWEKGAISKYLSLSTS